MDWSELRLRCEPRVRHLLDHVAMPNPWDIDVFLDRLEDYRCQPIDLCAVPWTAGESTGAWKRNGDHDIIAYAENTSPAHQDHIILHEVGHMISDHRGRCVLSLAEAQRLAPHLKSTALAHLLDRVSARSEEAEAETIASLILARAVRQRHRHPVPRHLDEHTAAALTRVTRAFDEPDHE